MALDEANDSYLVVGVAGGGGNVPTAFGKHFRRAAGLFCFLFFLFKNPFWNLILFIYLELAKAEVKWHGWEASVVQIARNQIERFEERLAESMNVLEEDDE